MSLRNMETCPQVSIIFPVLLPDNEFRRCIYSIKSVLEGHLSFEIICVVGDISRFKSTEFSDVLFIREAERGIYGAMNTGLKVANGRYLYFIGQDDILLPGALAAIKLGIDESADLIVGNVFWGTTGVFRNFKWRGVLVWRNWCHQGLFVNRLKFLESVLEFPMRFPVQADHFANVVYSGMPGIKSIKFHGCVAWYSSTGFSSRVADTGFRSVFPTLVKEHFGMLSWLIVVCRRFVLSTLFAVVGR
jgi:glycosyltransferase involved in cell wall biosynthesis